MFGSYDSLYNNSSGSNLTIKSLVSSSSGLAKSNMVLSTLRSLVLCEEVMNIDSIYIDDDWVQSY